MPTANKLPVDTSASATQMAEEMFGDGIQIVSASYTGADAASGIYSGGDAVAGDVTPGDTGVILSTGNAHRFTNSKGDANQSSGTSGRMQTQGDEDLEQIAGAKTYDAAVLEAEFVPAGSTLTMQVVFSSEEYLEYVDSGFNDAVGIWVNGHPAELSVGDGDITINNINDTSNENLYVDNPASTAGFNTEMDGFTVTLTLKAPVVPGQTNTIKIAIADGGDAYYDSNLLIAGNSVQTSLVATDDEVEITGGAEEVLDVLSNDVSSQPGTLTITMINGQAVVAGDTVVLTSGEEITLNADGTFTIDSDGAEATKVFSYQVRDSAGHTDTAFVAINTTPCFVAGTLIATPRGAIPVETLQPGELVLTRDNGAQPLRWIGCKTCKASGRDAPVRIQSDALGRHDEIRLSPNHRVLMASARGEVMFGMSETLVKAKHLVNGDTVRRDSHGGDVTYVHLLFDRHEVVCANGLFSESYHPGDQTLGAFDPETRDEVLRLMPDLTEPGFGYGPTARPTLQGFEARMLFSPRGKRFAKKWAAAHRATAR